MTDPVFPEPFATALANDRPNDVRDAPAQSAEAIFARAIARSRCGDLQGARTDFGLARLALPDPSAVELAIADIGANTDVEQAVAVARDVMRRAPETSALHARALYAVGLGEHRLRRSAEAILALADAAQVYASLGARREQAEVHDALGRVHGARGRLDLAVHHYALALVEKALRGDRRGSARSLVHLARVHLQAGRAREAIDCCARALAIAEEADDPYARACALNTLGEAHLDLAAIDEAEDAQRRCSSICDANGYDFVKFFAELGMARAALKRGSIAKAEDALEHLRAIHLRLARAELGGYVALLRGETLLVSGAPSDAVQALEEAVSAFSAADLPDYEIPARIALARACELDGKPQAAERSLMRAMRLARQESFARYLPLLNDALVRLGSVPSTIDEEGITVTGPDHPSHTSDGYVIRAKLGQGGFGEVFRAYDPVRGEEVALKRLPLGRLYDPDQTDGVLASLRLEIEAASRVRHPGVARVYAVGRTPEGDAYVVQEFVPGRSMRTLISSQPTADLRTVLRQSARIAWALEALHRAGVVHRDLKPDNVMIRPDDTPVLIDFGIARVAGFTKGFRDELIIGSLRFMAPEQALGATVDGRADLYALGVTIYLWMTGAVPVQPQGGSFTACAEDLSRRAPTRITHYRADVPASVAALVHQLLEKSADRRPQSAAIVARQLEVLAEEVRPAVGKVADPTAVTAPSPR